MPSKEQTSVLQHRKVFDSEKREHTKEPMFFGNSVNISRFDTMKYPFFEQQTNKQIGFSWVPQEVSLESDRHEFKMLPGPAQFIFTSNLLYQNVLDSTQGRGPGLSLLRCVSIPELESFIEAWAYFEGPIHSRSYSWIIRNIYDHPEDVFDQITEVAEIVERAEAVTKHYDSFINYNDLCDILGYGTHTINGEVVELNMRERYKRLYLMLHSIYILEGIRFYVSFACSWAFADIMKVMKKNAKIIKMICRDENVHMATVNYIIKRLKDGSEGELFKEIAVECKDEIETMFRQAAEQEFAWADYLFKDGSIIGLNAEILKDYVKFITNKRVKSLNIPQSESNIAVPFPEVGGSNPLPWTEKWISGKNVQVALQETENVNYTIGGINKDISDESKKLLKTMEL